MGMVACGVFVESNIFQKGFEIADFNGIIRNLSSWEGLLMNTISPETLSEISSLVGREHVISDMETLRSVFPKCTLSGTPKAGALVYPINEEQVAGIVRIAARAGLSLTPVGTGNQLSGVVDITPATLLVSLSKMNKILEIDDKNLMVSVEAGTTLCALYAALAEKNFFYPPLSDIMPDSSIGAIVALNAGGARSFRYGRASDYLMGVTAVTADGMILNAGRKALKDVAGYNLDRFMAGSRGTLGIITRVLLKVLPQPQCRAMIVSYYPSCAEALKASSMISMERFLPSMIEIMDACTIAALAKFNSAGLVTSAGALLMTEIDGHPAAVKDTAQAIEGICREAGATQCIITDSPEKEESLLQARMNTLAGLEKITGAAVLLEIKVPRTALTGFVENTSLALKEAGISSGMFGCAGNGHIYICLMPETGARFKSLKVSIEKVGCLATSAGGHCRILHIRGIDDAVEYIAEHNSTIADIAVLIKEAYDPAGMFKPIAP